MGENGERLATSTLSAVPRRSRSEAECADGNHTQTASDP